MLNLSRFISDNFGRDMICNISQLWLLEDKAGQGLALIF